MQAECLFESFLESPSIQKTFKQFPQLDQATKLEVAWRCFNSGSLSPAYLYSALRNAFYDALKEEAKRNEVSLEGLIEEHTESSWEPPELHDTGGFDLVEAELEIEDLFSDLLPDEQIILRMFAYGYTQEEIAQELNLLGFRTPRGTSWTATKVSYRFVELKKQLRRKEQKCLANLVH